MGFTFVNLDSNKGFPLHFKFVDTDNSNKIHAAYTTLSDADCTTEFYSQLFNSSNSGLVDLVVRHELGHCAGLNHDPNPGQIMYAVASPFSTYSLTANERFFTEVISSTGVVH